MKLLIVNPNTTAGMTDKIGDAARSVAAPGTDILAVNPDSGPVSIEGHYDEAYCVPGLLEEMARGKAAGVDAAIVACFDDPGLGACRELMDVPVLGICEAAMYAAAMTAGSFSVVTTLKRATPIIGALALRYGMERHCRSIRAAEVPVLALEEPGSDAADKVKAEVRRALEEDGAEAVLLGCAGMADLARRFTEEVGAPVIDGVAAAVKLAEGLVGLGLKTSKAGSFAAPRAKPYAGRYAAMAPGAPAAARAAE
ncbi:MAG: aspartate/glutamate racemase family protein [Alphaproteobacteria bacterium]|jgi:allantoin racemase|nr:aspartate/glutamate racemase family protein [Alphaproteobacteria bacterium]